MGLTGKGYKGAKFISYLRVSSEKQGASGLGIEAQRTAIQGFLEHNDGELLKEFVEVQSGKSAENRPELLKAINLCKLQDAVLVIARLDRLSRELWFITKIQKLNVRFVCADNPEISNFSIHILGAVAEHERKMISERTKAALAAAKKRGVKLGNPNLKDYRNTDTSSANLERKRKADEFAAMAYGEIKSAAEQIENANQPVTLTGIATVLNHLGIRTSRKKKWTPVAVKRVLERVRNLPKGTLQSLLIL